MKFVALIAATVVATAAISATPAAAGPRHGWHTKKVCKWVGRGHHKVKRCSNVKVRW